MSKFYMIFHHWSSDYDFKMFKDEIEALEHFKNLVTQHINYRNSKSMKNSIIKKAIKNKFFEYDCECDGEVKPHITFKVVEF